MTKKKYVTPEFQEIDPNLPIPKGTMYCPYCGKWQKFEPIKRNDYYTYPRCEECGISDEDWYVKLVNGIWRIEMGEVKRKGR
jgi:uncharacterized Zn finger protein